jgi:flagellar motor switch protein FliM
MSDEKDIDQDALAAAWGADLEEEEASDGQGEEGADWEAMMDGSAEPEESKSAAERVLNQDEIDNLLGFNMDELDREERQGIRAIINSALVSYERLPMLEIVFDRLVRLMTTSLRNFTSDNVEVSLESLRSIRFGDYLNSIPLPAMLGVFKAHEWDNYGLITVESNLIYAMVDVLLGGRRGQSQLRVEGRPYTTIETNLIRRMMEVILEDADNAFAPLSGVHFEVERLETNPRFAAIARPANAAVLVKLRVDMEDRGGSVEILLPYATIEPIRGLLLQMFMGEKFGRDPIWENHLAREVWQAKLGVDAVLFELDMPLSRAMNLEVGETIMLDVKPDDLITLRCGNIVLSDGRVGRIGEKIAVRVASPLRKPNMTFAAFEQADQLATEGVS